MPYTKLIERLRKAGYDMHTDVYALLPEAVSAIETLQSECAEHKENAIRNARQAVAFRADRDALQAENERLTVERDTNKRMRDLHFAEKNALQAKLDALQKQEPVDENFGVVMGFNEDGYALVDYPCEGNTIDLEEGMLLYAAPKALAPLTDERIYETIIQWDEGGGKRSRRELARRLSKLKNQQQQVANLILHEGLQIASPIESNSGIGTDIEHRFEVSDGVKLFGVVVIFTELAAHGIGGTP